MENARQFSFQKKKLILYMATNFELFLKANGKYETGNSIYAKIWSTWRMRYCYLMF